MKLQLAAIRQASFVNRANACVGIVVVREKSLAVGAVVHVENTKVQLAVKRERRVLGDGRIWGCKDQAPNHRGNQARQSGAFHGVNLSKSDATKPRIPCYIRRVVVKRKLTFQ